MFILPTVKDHVSWETTKFSGRVTTVFSFCYSSTFFTVLLLVCFTTNYWSYQVTAVSHEAFDMLWGVIPHSTPKGNQKHSEYPETPGPACMATGKFWNSKPQVSVMWLVISWTDVLPQHLEAARFGLNFFQSLSVKFDRHLGSGAAKMPAKFQSDTIFITANLPTSRLRDILVVRCLTAYWIYAWAIQNSCCQLVMETFYLD